jgi:phosphatidylethanolamine-binding protein (PEBP) family uncharacterized protein
MLTITFNKAKHTHHRRRRAGAIACGLLAALTLGCCGSSRSPITGTTGSGTNPTNPPPPTANATSATQAGVPVVNLELTSPVVGEGRPIPRRFTCDGANTSLPLRWGNVPTGTTELVVVIFNINPGSANSETFFDWAVAGLKPTLSGISAGVSPVGAVVGRNSFGQDGYTICPPKGRLQHYGVILYALAHPLTAKSGFDPSTLRGQAERTGKSEGLLGFYYKRS